MAPRPATYALKRLAAPRLGEEEGPIAARKMDEMWAMVTNELLDAGCWNEIKCGGKYPRTDLEHLGSVPVRGLQEKLRDATIRTYAHLLRLCTKLKSLPDGEEVHHHLLDRGYYRIPRLRNLSVQMYASCGALLTAYRFFKDDMHKNRYSFNTMIACAIQRGHLELADQIFNRMYYRDGRTWNLMVTAHAASGDVNKAAELLSGMNPWGKHSHIAQHSMIAAHGRNRDPVAAQRVFQQMRRHYVAAWNVMASAYLAAGHFGKAVGALESMEQWNDLSIAAAVVALCQAGLLQQAAAMFQSRVLGSSTFKHPAVAANALIAAYVLDHRLQQAKEFFDSLAEERKSALSYQLMIMAYARRGMVEEARQVFNSSPNRSRTNSTWVAMIRVYFDNGMAEHAREVFDMEEDRDAEVYAEMVQGYVLLGYLQQAQQMFDDMPKQVMGAWKALVEASVRAGLVTQVRELCEMEPDADCYSLVTAASITASTASGDLEGAEAIFRKSPEQITTSAAMLRAYASAGMTEKAASVFDRLQNKGAEAWELLADAFASSSRMEEAVQVLQRMPQRGWNEVSWGYLLEGRAQEALAVIGLMELEGEVPDRYNLLVALSACKLLLGDEERRRRVRAVWEAVVFMGFQSDRFLTRERASLQELC